MWTNIWLMLILFHHLVAVSPATLMKENSINENYLVSLIQICALLNINLPIAEALTNLFLFVSYYQSSNKDTNEHVQR